MESSTKGPITARRRAEKRTLLLRETEARRVEEMAARVKERTAELEQSQAELEAFSYSVSHDRRSPRRAVEGFSTALVEDYGAVGEGSRFWIELPAAEPGGAT